MADVTISQLPATTPVSSGVVPYSNGTTTSKVTLSQILALQSGVPSGAILLWSGSSASIPSGWRLCDGNNGTPNLVDRFVLGAGTTTPTVGSVGGSKDAIVVSHTHSITDPGHSHSITTNTSSNYGSSLIANNYRLTPVTPISTNSSTTGISIQSTGSSGINANMPPYYALCYIMKV